MFTRTSALCLAIGLVVGYAFAGSTTTAVGPSVNPAPPFVDVGDEFRLIALLDDSQHGPCTIAETQGAWARCAPHDKFASRPEHDWLNLNYAVRLVKRQK